jgi:hypothetical protein
VTQPYQAPNPIWVAPDTEPGGSEPSITAGGGCRRVGTISAQRVRQLRMRQRSDITFPVRLRPMRLVDVLDGAFRGVEVATAGSHVVDRADGAAGEAFCRRTWAVNRPTRRSSNS